MSSISGSSPVNPQRDTPIPSGSSTVHSDFSKNVYKFCLIAFPLLTAAALVSTTFSEKSPILSQSKLLEKQTQAITLSLVPILSNYLPHFFPVNIFAHSSKTPSQKTAEELIPFSEESEKEYRRIIESPTYKYNALFHSLVEMAEETDCSFDAIQSHASANKDTCDKPLITMYQLLQKAVEKNTSETNIVKKKILSILKSKNPENNSELFTSLLEENRFYKASYASYVTNESFENSKNLVEKDNGVYEDPLTFGLVGRYHPSKNVQTAAEKLLETLYDQVKPLNGTAKKTSNLSNRISRF